MKKDERVDFDVEALAAFVDEYWEKDALGALSSYTSVECLSPAFDKDWREHGEIGRAAHLLADFATARTSDETSVELLEIEERTPVLLVDVGATEDGTSFPTILVYGHLDKQPALGPWREGLEPFRAVRHGDRLYGRGTADDGYALFLAIGALKALETFEKEHGRIVVLIEASEESGSPDLDHYLDHLSPRLGEIGLVICLDSGGPSYDRLWLTSALRASLNVILRVDVLEEGVHSGLAGGIVPSSFRIARSLLSRLEDEDTGELRPAALRAGIPVERLAEMRTVVQSLGERAAGEFPTVPGLVLDHDPLRRLIDGTWGPSLSVTGAEGLPPLEQAGNVLRPFTALKLSFRLPPICDVVEAERVIRDTLTSDPPSGASVSVEVEGVAPGWNARRPPSWLSEVCARASMSYFAHAPGSIGIGGSIPFLSLLAARYENAAFLATGVLGPESNAHGPNEFLHLPSAKALTAIVATVAGNAR